MRKNIVLLVLVLVIMTMVGCSQVEQQEMMSSVTNALELPEVKAIREMTLDNGVKLGDLIESGLSSPTYELYDPAEDGNTYVTIKGNVNYNGQDIVAIIQYKKVEDDYYEFYALEYNEIAQNMLQVDVFFEYLFEQYADSIEEVVTNTSTDTTTDTTTESNSTSSQYDSLMTEALVRLDLINDMFSMSDDFDRRERESIEDDLKNNIQILDKNSPVNYNSLVFNLIDSYMIESPDCTHMHVILKVSFTNKDEYNAIDLYEDDYNVTRLIRLYEINTNRILPLDAFISGKLIQENTLYTMFDSTINPGAEKNWYFSFDVPSDLDFAEYGIVFASDYKALGKMELNLAVREIE